MHNPRALHMRSVLDDPRAVGRLRSVTSSFAFPGGCYLLVVLCGVYVCDDIPRLVHHSPVADSFSENAGQSIPHLLAGYTALHCSALCNISA